MAEILTHDNFRGVFDEEGPDPLLQPVKLHVAEDWLQTLAAPEWVIDGLLVRGHLTAITGHSSSGKTAVAVALAVHVAAKIALGGRRIAGGKVLYIAAENAEDVKLRMAATIQAMRLHTKQLQGRLLVFEGGINLEERIEAIRAACLAHGEFALVIGDTNTALFASAAYDDENSNAQQARHVRAIRSLISLPGSPACVPLCHPAAAALIDQLKPRGGSSYFNELDANFVVSKDDDVVTLTHNKLRQPEFEPLHWQLNLVKLEVWRKDESAPRAAHTVAATVIAEDEHEALVARQEQDENRLLVAIRDHSDGTLRDWASAAGFLIQSGANAGEPHLSRVHRSLRRLADDKLVRKYRRRWMLTEAGKRETNGEE